MVLTAIRTFSITYFCTALIQKLPFFSQHLTSVLWNESRFEVWKVRYVHFFRALHCLFRVSRRAQPEWFHWEQVADIQVAALKAIFGSNVTEMNACVLSSSPSLIASSNLCAWLYQSVAELIQNKSDSTFSQFMNMQWRFQSSGGCLWGNSSVQEFTHINCEAWENLFRGTKSELALWPPTVLTVPTIICLISV